MSESRQPILAPQTSEGLSGAEKLTRLALVAGCVYFGTNAAIDFGAGIEARSAVNIIEQQSSLSPEIARSLTNDQHDALRDAEKQLGLGAIMGIGYLVIRRTQQKR